MVSPFARSWQWPHRGWQPHRLVHRWIHPDPTESARFTATATATGPPGAVVNLGASTDLGDTDPWRKLSHLTLDASGNGFFNDITDRGSLGSKQRFFRLRIE